MGIGRLDGADEGWGEGLDGCDGIGFVGFDLRWGCVDTWILGDLMKWVFFGGFEV